MSIQNGAFTEYGPSHQKASYSTPNFGYSAGNVRNHGSSHRFNFMAETSRYYRGYDNCRQENYYERNNIYNRDYDLYNGCGCNRGGGRSSFLNTILPMGLGIAAVLLGPSIGKFFSNLFGRGKHEDNGVDRNNRSNENSRDAITNLEAKNRNLELEIENLKKSLDTKNSGADKKANGNGTDAAQQAVDAGAPQANGTKEGSSPKAKENETKVKLGDTIFTLIQKEKPELSKEDILKLVDKTIAANKTLLDSNNTSKPIYNEPPRKLGDYIEVGDMLKLILE